MLYSKEIKMEDEYYEEVPTEYDYEEDEITVGDIMLVVGIVVLACLVFALVMGIIKKTFKNVHLKIGNKIELGVETKDDKNVSKGN